MQTADFNLKFTHNKCRIDAFHPTWIEAYDHQHRFLPIFFMKCGISYKRVQYYDNVYLAQPSDIDLTVL
jgi:hypothetical protein